MEISLDTTTDFGKLVSRMNRAYGSFLMWKYIRKSMSIPENGQGEAERRTNIMNRYGGIFTGILYATENTFINDLHKFFDKPKDSLKLQTLVKELPEADRREAETLLEAIRDEVDRIRTLRNNVTAHEPKNPEEEKIFTLEIEKIFSVVQKVLNIISRSYGGGSLTWELWEGTNEASFTKLLNDLELGYHTASKHQNLL